MICHAGIFLTLDGAAPSYQITGTLETIGRWNAGGNEPVPANAHVWHDPARGELCTLSYDVEQQPYVMLRLIDAAGRIKRTVPIELPGLPTMMHDFMVTEHNVALCHGPVDFNWEAAMQGQSPLRWSDNERGSRYGVMPKDGDAVDIAWHETEPSFVFHFVNAFEQRDKVVFDGTHHAWLDFGGTSDEPTPPPGLLHTEIDLETSRIDGHRWNDKVCEFPRFDERHDGLATRYMYSPTTVDEATGFNGMMRVDAQNGETSTYGFGTYDSVGEPVFAPDPSSNAEDDGWVMAFVYDDASDNSHLVLWDAGAIEDGPTCRILMPRRIPEGLHVNWMPDP